MNNRDNLDNTQPIKPIGDGGGMRQNHVRELHPVDVNPDEVRSQMGGRGAQKVHNNSNMYRTDGGADPFSNGQASHYQASDFNNEETQFIPVQDGFNGANGSYNAGANQQPGYQQGYGNPGGQGYGGNQGYNGNQGFNVNHSGYNNGSYNNSRSGSYNAGYNNGANNNGANNNVGNSGYNNGNRGYNGGYNGGNGGYNGGPGNNNEDKGSGTKIALLIVGFLVALFLGMTISGYMHDKDVKETQAANAKIQQEQQLRQQAQQNEQEKQSLKQQRSDLEQKLKDLQRQQQEAQSVIDKLEGQNQQLAKDNQSKSTLGKLADSLSGNDKKQQREAVDNSRQAADAQSKLEAIGESIRTAQEAYDDVNDKIDKFNEMKQKADNVKAKVTEAYDDNRGTVDTILHYAGQGLSLLLNALK